MSRATVPIARVVDASSVEPMSQKPTEAVQPLLWGKADVRTALGVSEATFDRMLSGGRFPKPDLRIGRMPKWKPSTVTGWIDAQTRKGVRR